MGRGQREKLSAGRKKWRHGAYLCLLPAPTGGEVDITAQYVARFGEPEPGTKVFIRTHQQRNGWKDMEKDLSEVVPVKTEAGAREAAIPGAGVTLTALCGLNQLPKLQELNGLAGVSGVREGGAARGVGKEAAYDAQGGGSVLLPRTEIGFCAPARTERCAGESSSQAASCDGGFAPASADCPSGQPSSGPKTFGLTRFKFRPIGFARSRFERH